MALNITLPFHVVKLRLTTGEEVIYPLSDINAFRLSTSPAELAEQYAGLFQKKILDHGQYTRLLSELQDGVFTKKHLTLQFPASNDGISYPDFELEFAYFALNLPSGFWGTLPALGVEALANDEATLEQRLSEAAMLEFASENRLKYVQRIVDTHLFEDAEIERREIQVKIPSLAELEALKKQEQQSQLPDVATQLQIRAPSAYGREKELATMERMVNSRFNRSILIVGPSGAGKTALVWEFARRRAQYGIKAQIWETTASILIKEMTKQTGWQDNLSLLAKDLMQKGDILFVRNLAELFEVGQYEGNDMSMAEYLRPFLGRSEITLFSECTPEERARIEVRSPGYLAFFQILELKEPKAEAEHIILSKINDVAKRTGIGIDPEAVSELIRLHRRFFPYSGMPGKPIRFLESILLGTPKPPAPRKKAPAIRKKEIFDHFCQESGMPPFMVDPTLPMDPANVRQLFNSEVFGQEHAVNAVVDMLAAVKTALTRTGKPIASFLFVGPTGVGKTELAKVLAGFMFGNRERMIRFDMSEFSQPWLVARLTGQGFNSDGLLTSAVRREPFCVLLFDEIEKADPTFLDLLLQMLGEGRLSDSRGRLVNFCSTIIIMTSNIGAEKMQRRRIGWGNQFDPEEITWHFTKAVEDHFRPELFNRIDSIVAFRPLSPATMRQVVEREIALFKMRDGIRFRHLELQIAPELADYLAEIGYDPRYGARYLQRTLRERLFTPIARELNKFPFDDHLSATIQLEAGELRIEAKSNPLGFDLLMERWDKLTLAEQVSSLRRHVKRIGQGPTMLNFNSEMDMLEQDKAHYGPEFWLNVSRAAKYVNYLSAYERYGNLHAEIESLEVEAALASMEQGPHRADISERLEKWDSDLFDLLTTMHSLIYPALGNCYFGLYGFGLEAPLRFYLSLFDAKKFMIKKAYAVWFRENPSGKAQKTAATQPAPENQNTPTPQAATPPTHYFREAIDRNALDYMAFPPPKKNDLLCGIELELSAPGIWLYLKEEKGFQHWDSSGKNVFTPYSVHINPNPFATPDDIHRQSYYVKNKPRRTVKGKFVSDLKLDISRELPSGGMVAFFIEKLDEVFRANMERAFLDEEWAGQSLSIG